MGLICRGDPHRPPSAVRSFDQNETVDGHIKCLTYGILYFILQLQPQGITGIGGGSIATEHSMMVTQPLQFLRALSRYRGSKLPQSILISTHVFQIFTDAFLQADICELEGVQILTVNSITLAPTFAGVRNFLEGRGFKQWMEDDSKALMKVLLKIIVFISFSYYGFLTDVFTGDQRPCLTGDGAHYMCLF